MPGLGVGAGIGKTSLGTLLNQIPDIPTGLTALSLSESSIKLDWTNGAKLQDGISIERSLDGLTGWVEVGTSIVETYTDTTLDFLNTYYFRIRARKGNYYSAYSDVVSATTLLLTTGLIANIDASALTGLNDNDPVTTITDISGNNNSPTQAVSTKRALYKAGVVNGLPIVRSDGVDDFYTKYPLSLPQPLTSYFVLSKTGGAVVISDFNGIKKQVNSITRISINNGVNLQIDVTPKNTNIPFIMTSVDNGVSSILSYNGGGPTKLGNAGINNGDRITLFSDSPNTQFSAVDFCQKLIYYGAHDSTTRRKIETYLGGKWGIVLEPT